MFKILINKKTETIDFWIFEVRIFNENGESEYLVTLDKDYYVNLTGGKILPLVLVERSFIFLLSRETSESILRDFNLKEILNYFKDFESEIKKGL